MNTVLIVISCFSTAISVISVVAALLWFRAFTRSELAREREVNHFRNELKQNSQVELQIAEGIEEINRMVIDLRDVIKQLVGVLKNNG